MTGLPQKDAQTTGTVAVASWARDTLLSPRASQHGYSWRDTIAHELTHLAVTRATVDRAPLWLQEGVAKRQEIRWRPPGPFDDRPSPDAIVTRGMELKLDLLLDRLGPQSQCSRAPTRRWSRSRRSRASSATSRRRARRTRWPGCSRASGRGAPRTRPCTTRRGPPSRSGTCAGARTLADKPRETLPAVSGWAAEDAGASSSSSSSSTAHADLHELSRRARLAELLMGRSHPAEALVEMDRVTSAQALEDPSLRYLRARVLEALGRAE